MLHEVMMAKHVVNPVHQLHLSEAKNTKQECRTSAYGKALLAPSKPICIYSDIHDAILIMPFSTYNLWATGTEKVVKQLFFRCVELSLVSACVRTCNTCLQFETHKPCLYRINDVYNLQWNSAQFSLIQCQYVLSSHRKAKPHLFKKKGLCWHKSSFGTGS